jgi:hypothetical protein
MGTMKLKTLIILAATAAVGYIIARDKAQKERVKMLVKQDAFKDYSDEKEVY